MGVAEAISGAGALAGGIAGLMGGKGGDGGGSASDNPANVALQATTEDFYRKTGGPREAMLFNWGDMFGIEPYSLFTLSPQHWTKDAQGNLMRRPANYDVSQLPQYEPLFGLQKQSLEAQYQQAKKNLMGSTPEGGSLTAALSNLENNRASAVGNLPAQIAAPLIADEMNKAYGAAFNAPTTTVSGLGSAASTYANQANANLASVANADLQTYGLLSGMGRGLGQVLGGGKGVYNGGAGSKG